MFVNFRRVFKFAAQDFGRNIWLSIVNITILILALLTINFLIIFNLLTNNAIHVIKEKVDVSIYFKQTITQEQIDDLKQKISSSQYIKSVDYVSEEESLENFITKHAQDENLLNAIEELKKDNSSVFLASLKIKAKDISMYESILKELKESQYVDLFEIDENQFQDYTLMTQRLINISDKIRLFAYVLSGVFMLIAFMMVFNTIKIAIYTHRDEIAIMKLVGATENFIKAPFILNILFYNMIALILIIVIVYLGGIFLQPIMDKLFEGYTINLISYFNSNFIVIFFGQLLLSCVFSIISSLISIKRYLKF
ncbi:MAG: permease-like cell division protein FtsX [Patescibacteria group bacterium]|nr:permease-like cell division protein FtsX [Patescibacteria group bacterium]